MTLSKQEIAGLIDHTYLKPDAASGHIERLCAEAVQHNFFSACVPRHLSDLPLLPGRHPV